MFKKNRRVYGIYRDHSGYVQVAFMDFMDVTKKEICRAMLNYLCHDELGFKLNEKNVIEIFTKTL